MPGTHSQKVPGDTKYRAVRQPTSELNNPLRAGDAGTDGALLAAQNFTDAIEQVGYSFACEGVRAILIGSAGRLPLGRINNHKLAMSELTATYL